MARQLHFYRLANTLREAAGQDVLPPDRGDLSVGARGRSRGCPVPGELNDVSSAFASSTSDMVERGLAQGHVMLALSLPAWLACSAQTLDAEGARCLGSVENSPAPRNSPACVASFTATNFRPTASRKPRLGVRSTLSLAQNDAFVLCLAPDWQASLALEAVRDRALLAHHRLPREVRNVTVSKGAPLDGTTGPMRPLPSGARMYPETDVPPLPLKRAMGSAERPSSTEQRGAPGALVAAGCPTIGASNRST